MKKNKSIDGLTIKDPREHIKKAPVRKKVVEKNSVGKIIDKELGSNQAKKQSSKERLEEVANDFLKPVTAFKWGKSPKKIREKEKKKVSKLRKIITSILLIIILLIIGIVIWGLVWGNDIIEKITSGRGNIWDVISALTNEIYEPLKTDQNGRTNILAFGTSGYDMGGTSGKGKHPGAQLTDSIMIISLNQKTGDVAMLSLPRDLKVGTCTATGKVNEVYKCGMGSGKNEEAGAKALMEKMKEVLGVELQYYAHINWGALVKVVDILDGITVTLDKDVDDRWKPGWDGATNIVIKAGEPRNLNGEQALALARSRHGISGGDFGRGESQQKILIAIKEKIYMKNLSMGDMLGLFSTLGDNLKTNLAIGEIKTLSHLTFEFDFKKIRQITLLKDEETKKRYMTTGTINGISYVLPSAGESNYNEIKDYIAEKLKEPEPKEKITE